MPARSWRKASTQSLMRLKLPLGPKGRNVVLDKEIRFSTITNDGNHRTGIELEDHFENMGAQLVKEVATRPMMWRATAPRLQQYWRKPWSASLKNVAAGANPMFLKRHRTAVNAVVDRIKEVAKPVETKSAIAQVASFPQRIGDWRRLPTPWKSG